MKKFLSSRIEEILMLLGAILWITGEMIAVFVKKEDTTTEYVRKGKKLPGWRGIVVTLMAFVGTVWLYLHFVHDKIG